MKKPLLASLLFLSFYNIHAQTIDSTFAEPDLYQSAAGRFSDSAGLLIQREFIPMGHVLDCNISVVHLTDLNGGTKMSALIFSNQSNRSATVDADELPALIRALQVIKEKVSGVVPENPTQITFQSRCGFEAGCRTEAPVGEWSKKLRWTVYLQMRRGHSSTSTTINPKKKDLDVFLQILDNAKAKL